MFITNKNSQVTNLKRQETYYFKVTAENAIGSGPPLVSGKCTLDYSFSKFKVKYYLFKSD